MKKILIISNGAESTQNYSAALSDFEPDVIRWEELNLINGVPSVKLTPITDYEYVVIGAVYTDDKCTALYEYLDAHQRPYFSHGYPPYRNNKLLQSAKLETHQLPQPKTIIGFGKSVDADNLIAQLKLPIVSKITNGAQGKGIEKHDTKESLEKRLKNDADVELIFQEFIANDGDFRVMFIKGEFIHAIKRTTTDAEKEFRNNISLGGTFEQVELAERGKEISAAAVKAMGFDIAGVDVIQRKGTDEWFLLEINAAPQFTLPELLLPKITEYVKTQLLPQPEPTTAEIEAPKPEELVAEEAELEPKITKLLIITAEPENFVPVELAKSAERGGIEARIIDERTVIMSEGGKDAPGKLFLLEKDKLVELEVGPETMVIPRLNEYNREAKIGMMKRLQLNGAKLLNTPESMEICNNKLMTHIVLNSAGIATPWTFTFQSDKQVEAVVNAFAEDKLKFPSILKTFHGTHGVGVMKLDSKGSMISVAQAMRDSKLDILGQEFCKHEKSQRIIMIGDELLAANERGQPKEKDEFRTNSHLGSETEKYEPSEAEVELGRKIVNLIGAKFCAIDYLKLEDGKLLVMEVNGSPGLEAMQKNWPEVNLTDKVISLACGIEIKQQDETPVVPEVKPEVATEPEKMLKLVERISIAQIYDNGVDARIDTGAAICSLHALEVREQGDMVAFTVSDRRFKALKRRTILVKNVHGGEPVRRFVVALNVSICGQSHQEVEFSLNNREHMKYEVLIGRNLLELVNLPVEVAPPEAKEEE